MITCTVGQFDLHLEQGGKLRQVILPDATPLLHECSYTLDTGAGRVFNPSGWDECFPSIEPFEDVPTMGDLIWQAPQVYRTAGQVEQVWHTPGYMAQRVFQARDPAELEMIFRVRAGNEPLRFLWASHALFSVAGLQAVELPDRQQLNDFSINGTCRKFFVRAGSPVVLHRGGSRVELETDQPWWGIWYNRGGWPSGRPARFSCIGIEATNTAADAPTNGQIPAGGSFEGRVTLRVS